MYPRKFARKSPVRDASTPLVEMLESRTLLSADGGDQFALAEEQSLPRARGTIVGGDAVSFGAGGTNASAATQVFAHDFGAKGDGVTDDASAIQQALNSAPLGAVVMLDAGKTYRIASPLVIRRTVSFDGNGATLLLSPGQGTADTWFDIHSDTAGVTYAWKQTITAGQNSFQANIPASQIQGGDWILVSLGEDSGNAGQPQYQRLVRVVSNDGTTLVVNRTVPFDITAGSLDNSIRKVASPANNITLRNLNLDFPSGVSPSSAVRALAVAGLTIANLTGRIAGFDLTACNDITIQGVTGQLSGRIAVVSLVSVHRSQDVEIRDGQVTWGFNRPAVSVDSWSRNVRIAGLSLTCVLRATMDGVFAVAGGASQVRIENSRVRTFGPASLITAEDPQSVSVLNTTLIGWYRSIPTARASLLTVNGVTYTDMSQLTFPVDPGPAPTGTPTGLRVADRDRQHISLAWDNSTANQAWFEVQRGTDGTNFATVATVDGDTTDYTDAAVQPGITYYYRVRAANYAGEAAFSTAVPAVARTGLQVTFGDTGIQKITFGDYTLLDLSVNPWDGFAVGDYMIQHADGTTAHVSGALNFHSSFDLATTTVTWQYAWGAVSCQYVVSDDQIQINVHVVNNSPTDTLVGVNVIPFIIQFPEFPDGFQACPYVGMNVDGPTVFKAAYGQDAVVFANEQIGKPLLSGLFSTNETATTRRWQVWVGSLPESWFPGGWSGLSRPVPPGGSDTYNVSLRFGDKATPIGQTAGDVFQQYEDVNPPELAWDDRRAIGALHIASEGSSITATNPHGWWIGYSIDTTTPAGLEDFRAEMLASADASIAVLKSANAQGMIVWGVEGFGHEPAYPYYGAPDMATTLSPELDYQGTIDEYFKRFRDAGLRTGVTLRPMELTDVNGVISQFESSDPVQTIIRRARYAHERWGCTLFYIDSPNGITADSMRIINEALPNCLFSPEGFNMVTGWYSASAPYLELRGGVTETPDTALAYNPAAFTLIQISGGDFLANHDVLVASVKHGNILLFNAWYGNAAVDAVIAIYDDAKRDNA